MKLKNYSLDAKKLADIEFEKGDFKAASSQQVKDYVTAYRRNQRQWSASTKGRSEVSHSNKKPHRQKGTGRARQGTLAAPQYKGGGVVFGPKPKFDQHVRINQKEKRSIIRTLLADKIGSGEVFLVDKLEMKEPKTKKIAKFITQCGLGKRVLFVLTNDGDKQDVERNFKKSVQNLEKVDWCNSDQLNGYALLRARHLVLTEKTLKKLMEV